MWTIPTKVRKYKGMKLQRLHHVKLDIDVSNQSSYKSICNVDNTNQGTKLRRYKGYIMSSLILMSQASHQKKKLSIA